MNFAQLVNLLRLLSNGSHLKFEKIPLSGTAYTINDFCSDFSKGYQRFPPIRLRLASPASRLQRTIFVGRLCGCFLCRAYVILAFILRGGIFSESCASRDWGRGLRKARFIIVCTLAERLKSHCAFFRTTWLFEA